MSIVRNPYGVGHSGDDFVDLDSRCACCGLPYRRRVLRRDQHQPAAPCQRCSDHVAVDGERLEREVARLREHEPRLLAYADAARRAANLAVAQADSAKSRWERDGAQVASALRSRNQWQDRARAAEEQHQRQPDGRCVCGQQDPCDTTTAMLRAGGTSPTY